MARAVFWSTQITTIYGSPIDSAYLTTGEATMRRNVMILANAMLAIQICVAAGQQTSIPENKGPVKVVPKVIFKKAPPPPVPGPDDKVFIAPMAISSQKERSCQTAVRIRLGSHDVFTSPPP